MGRVIGHLSRRLFGCLELENTAFRPFQLHPQLLNFSLVEAHSTSELEIFSVEFGYLLLMLPLEGGKDFRDPGKQISDRFRESGSDFLVLGNLNVSRFHPRFRINSLLARQFPFL